MYIELDESLDMPIYLQLANQIIAAIADGRLKPYDALPSGRMLAADLGINMHTVNKAYHYLEDKRLLQVQPKSGAIVHPEALRKATLNERNHLRERLRPIVDEAACLGITADELINLLQGDEV